MAKKKTGLGRGLGALIEETKSINTEKLKGVNDIAIDKIKPNPYQPRTTFQKDTLEELSQSIKKIGVIQPITVRLLEDNETYELISGERRWRASQMAGLKTIPAYVREADTQGMLEMAIVENIQREDLDAIEIALSFQQLITECNLTQEQLSERVSKNRATISNYLRLLKLPPSIQIGVREGKISMGHAKAIMSLDEEVTQLMIFEQILKYGFSVRKTEEDVKLLKEGIVAEETIKKPRTKTLAEYKALKNHLSKFFDTKVNLKIAEEGKGKIIISFETFEKLEKIIGILDKL
jgi:ParB family chromosome partitioning protein